jgi:hypothetical protein
VQCYCGKIGCAGGGRTRGSHTEYTCPWCGNSFTPVPVYSLNVKSGDY